MLQNRTLSSWPILLVFLAGCGGSYPNRVTLIHAGGTVTLDGAPLDRAIVIFEAADRSFSYAQTDAWGRYTLRFDSKEKGVTPGQKTVRISMNRRLLGLNSNE